MCQCFQNKALRITNSIKCMIMRSKLHNCRPYRILIPDLKIRILNPIFSKRIGFQILFQKADLDLDFLLSKQNPIRIWKSGFWVVDLRSKSNFFLLWSTFFDNLWRRKAKIFVGYYFFSFLKFSKKKTLILEFVLHFCLLKSQVPIIFCL